MPAIIGGAIVGGAMLSSMGASKSAKKAAKAQKKMMARMEQEAQKYQGYANQNRDFYQGLATTGKNEYNALGRELEADYRAEGTDALNRYYDSSAQGLRNTGYEGMMGILNKPSGVRDDAAYKFMQSEAETSTARAAGARGMGNSSNVLNALQERRLNVADTYLNSIMSRYGTAYGMGEQSRTQGLSMQDQYTSSGIGQRANMQATGIGSYLQNMGNAQAAYQGMLDSASNLRVGQGAQNANAMLGQYQGAAAGAPYMALGQGLSGAASAYGMMSMRGKGNLTDADLANGLPANR
jgi:hypothetical protein